MKNLFLLRHCEAYHFEENKSDHEKQLNENGRKCARLLKNWFENYINHLLGDLINLTEQKIDNQYLRALVFQLYEKNGVIKRNEIENIIKLISKLIRIPNQVKIHSKNISEIINKKKSINTCKKFESKTNTPPFFKGKRSCWSF